MIEKKYDPQKIKIQNPPINSDLSIVFSQDGSQVLSLQDLLKKIVQEALIRRWALSEQKSFKFQTYQLPQFFSKNDVLVDSKNLAKRYKNFRLQVSQKKKIEKKNQNIFSKLFDTKILQPDFVGLLQDQKVQDFLNYLLENSFLKKQEELLYWDISTQSYVHGDELIWQEVKETQLEIKCFVETKNDTFTLIVDGPLSLFGDLGVLVHPKDKRYKKHVGKNLILPLINRSIPIFGDDSIDTIAENGVCRINPHLSREMMLLAREYKLGSVPHYRDNFANFSVNISSLEGKNIFEFKNNIIDAFETIGNLVSKKTIKVQKPFSKKTKQELLPQIAEVWTLDLGARAGEFQEWLAEHYPHLELQLLKQLVFPIQKKSLLGHHLYLDLSLSQPRVLQADFFQKQKTSMFEHFVVLVLLHELLPSAFSLELFTDFLYVFGEEGVSKLLATFYPLDQIQAFIAQLFQKDAEEQLAFFEQSFARINRLQQDPDSELYSLLEKRFIDYYPIGYFALDTEFLMSLWLSFQLSAQSHSLPYFGIDEHYLRDYYLFLSYLGIDSLPAPLEGIDYEISLSGLSMGRLLQLQKKYGTDFLRLAVIKYEKYDAFERENEFNYLKHLWNLYKYLFEKSADLGGAKKDELEKLPLGGIEAWILTMRYELLNSLLQSKSLDSLRSFLLKLQDFTTGPFSRYLSAQKKQEKHPKFSVEHFLFYQIVLILSIFTPDLSSYFLDKMSNSSLHSLDFYLENPFDLLKKDYKIQLFFDLLASILQYKKEHQIPKHQKIKLMIKANSDVGELLEHYQDLLLELCPIEEFTLQLSPKELPQGYEIIRIYDIEIGVALVSKNQQSPLESLQQLFLKKEKELEELRSLLSILSMSGFSGSEKMQAKESQMEQLKDELALLDIQIKKIKMERKQS